MAPPAYEPAAGVRVGSVLGMVRRLEDVPRLMAYWRSISGCQGTSDAGVAVESIDHGLAYVQPEAGRRQEAME